MDSMDTTEINDLNQIEQNFFQLKLNSLKVCNEHLRGAIKTAEDTIVELNGNPPETGLMIGSIWKKYHNNKWCFIVDISISASDAKVTYSNFNISMEWSPIISPTYTLSIYSKNLKDFVTETTQDFYLIITFDIISFTNYKSYALTAALFYESQSHESSEAHDINDNSNVRFGIRLPKLEVGVDELKAKPIELYINYLHLTNGDLLATLSVMACLMQIRLAMKLSMGTSLKHYLIVDCMFRELPVDFRHGSKCFLLDTNVGPYDGCLLKFIDQHDVHFVDLYVRDEIHLHNVLHYLHLNIKGINIVPLSCKSMLNEAKENNDENEELAFHDVGKEFAESLLRQIDIVIDFYENVVGNEKMSLECDVTDEYHAMRKTLTRNEQLSDSFHQMFKSD